MRSARLGHPKLRAGTIERDELGEGCGTRHVPRPQRSAVFRAVEGRRVGTIQAVTLKVDGAPVVLIGPAIEAPDDHSYP